MVDHMVTMGELSRGIEGNRVVFVNMDITSGLRVAYPLPDKSAESTTMAIRMFAGKRMLHKLYSDRSGEIHKALQHLASMPHGSQPGVPQTNAVVARGERRGTERRNRSTVGSGTAALFLGL